ncbi:EpsG family protein [Methylophilus sp. Leaf414]|uniref:EpsG family protein n=1 Tax=Methylophilus sp. Leaf414 TaxID=1736371 RepID=UPI0006FE70DA|nr:EpsG family protein [Methylophilus sp. Leaf414]KQT34337.1 hypothetical protein ASG24_11470 [Methylophilus sp. Leaf414]
MYKKILTTEWLYLLAGIAAYIICVRFSKDWIHYQWWFGLLQNKTWPTVWQELSIFREPLYNFPVKFLSPYIGFEKVILIATISLTCIKLRTLQKIVPERYVGMFFYICLYWLLLEGTQLRVAYATTFAVLSFYYLQNQRYYLSILMIAIASQIHFTAILFSLVFVLYFIKRTALFTLCLFLLCPLLIIFEVSIYAWLEQGIAFINPRYLLYGSEKIKGQNSTGLYIYFIAFFWTTLVLIEWKLKPYLQVDRFKLAIQRLAMSGVIFMCVFHDHVALGARLGELLLFPLVILLSWLYLELHRTNKRLTLHLLTTIFFTYFIARFIYLFPDITQNLRV